MGKRKKKEQRNRKKENVAGLTSLLPSFASPPKETSSPNRCFPPRRGFTSASPLAVAMTTTPGRKELVEGPRREMRSSAIRRVRVVSTCWTIEGTKESKEDC